MAKPGQSDIDAKVTGQPEDTFRRCYPGWFQGLVAASGTDAHVSGQVGKSARTIMPFKKLKGA